MLYLKKAAQKGKKGEGVRARASLGGHCGETKLHREEENSMENQVPARLDVPGVSDTATRAETAKTTSGGRQGWSRRRLQMELRQALQLHFPILNARNPKCSTHMIPQMENPTLASYAESWRRQAD